ncbi:MAG TPA: radical SAM protein [Candidatus Binataceae bacterium]|nr:radical SAM protein [Candidatus Binataceae bacterium]
MAGRRYTSQPATRALTPTGGFLKGFAYSLNPYVGCGFGAGGGCPFCYVRMLPVAHAQKGGWGEWVIAKSNLPDLLEKELCALERAARLDAVTVFMSSATDPYQGIERRLELSRRSLERFRRHRIRRLLVQTRSPMVERDIELLRALGGSLSVSITLETDDESVRRAITPTSSSVERRLLTCTRLRDAGIFVQVAIAPMLPNHPARFAEMVDKVSDRVVLDTYFDGDGAKGRRSRALGVGELYERLGYARWFKPGAERELLARLQARMGHDRVLFSQAGFNAP